VWAGAALDVLALCDGPSLCLQFSVQLLLLLLLLQGV
jgi:hypothetical protein